MSPSNDPNYNLAYQQMYRKKPWKLADMRARHKARYQAEKDGKVVKNWDTEVDHKNGNPQDNRPSNLRIIKRALNRKLWAEKANRNKK